ncbi:MAG: hypothetical protein WBF71_09385 [Microthrixaceae bacterium]
MSFRRNSRRPLMAVLVATFVVAGLVTSCVPRRTSDTSTVKGATHLIEGAAKPPVFPTTNVPKALLIDGLIYDFAVAPLDPDYWSPSKKEAKCAATAIVDRIGAQRISDLGYRVDTPGASLNDVALTTEERDAVVEEFSRCVDMQEALAALLFGDGRIRTRAATCLSQVISTKGLLPQFVKAWIFGEAVNPFASDAALASALSTGSQVCINANDLNWPDLSVPGSDQGLIDASAPPGSRSSAYADDRPSEDVATSTTVDGN